MKKTMQLTPGEQATILSGARVLEDLIDNPNRRKVPHSCFWQLQPLLKKIVDDFDIESTYFCDLKTLNFEKK